MQHRYSPLRPSESILLYGFGLALALSLAFNGFLLYKQSQQRSIDEYELGNPTRPANVESWEPRLSASKRVNQQQDSRIGSPADSLIGAGAQRTSAPDQAVAVQHTSSK